MKKIILSSDSTTDLGQELIEKHGVHIIPLGVTLGTDVYRDGIDITPDEIYAYHKENGVFPKTTAVNVGEATDYFAELKKEAESVIHFTIGSDMSSTYNNCLIAASEFENIYVVDTKNLSTGGGLLVMAAADMIEQGMQAEEIVEKLKDLVPCVDASFVIDSLEYLHKGGRCSALSMLGANLLKLKPCIEVKGGKMGVGKKYRGKYGEVLKEYVAERLQDKDSIVLDRVFVTHAGCDMDIVNDVAALVKETLPFKELYITRASCTISSHCGANTLGVLFIRKSPIEQ